MPRKKQNLALQTLEPHTERFPAAPFVMSGDEAEFFAVELITKRMLESDWNEDLDAGAVRRTYGLSEQQVQGCIREARRNTRRAILRPQGAHELVTSTLASVIEQSMQQGDLRAAADAAYKLSQATGTQATIKLKVLEQQQRMDLLKTKLLTGQSSAEEVAAVIVSDLMGHEN